MSYAQWCGCHSSDLDALLCLRWDNVKHTTFVKLTALTLVKLTVLTYVRLTVLTYVKLAVLKM